MTESNFAADLTFLHDFRGKIMEASPVTLYGFSVLLYCALMLLHYIKFRLTFASKAHLMS